MTLTCHEVSLPCVESFPCSIEYLHFTHGEVIKTSGASSASFKAKWLPSVFDIERAKAFRLLINYCFHGGNHNKWFVRCLTKNHHGDSKQKIESTFTSCWVVLRKIPHGKVRLLRNENMYKSAPSQILLCLMPLHNYWIVWMLECHSQGPNRIKEWWFVMKTWKQRDAVKLARVQADLLQWKYSKKCKKSLHTQLIIWVTVTTGDDNCTVFACEFCSEGNSVTY